MSDHEVAWCVANFRAPPDKKIIYSYRAYTEAGVTSFLADLHAQSWEAVYASNSTDEKAHIFVDIVETLMNKNFKWKAVVRKENDPPWINETLRRLWKKRRKVYDREGRSARWRRLKKKYLEIHMKRAKTYLEIQTAKLTSPDASKHFFKHVKSFSCKERPKHFEIRELFPGFDDKAVAEKLGDHFSTVAGDQTSLAFLQQAEARPRPSYSYE